MQKPAREESSSPSVPVERISIATSSAQFLLTEFTRIQEGESYNRSSGELRVNLYLTLVSLAGASLVGLWKLVDRQSLASLREFYLSAFIILSFVSLIGMIVFKLLLQRWRLTIVYLRKLARIRRWFTEQDPSLLDHLVYSTDDTEPSFKSRQFLSSSLLTLVSVLNSISFTASLVFLVLTLFFSFFLSPAGVWTLGLLGIVASVAVWLGQRQFASVKLSRLEENEFSAFPHKD